jgi:hypothetical protein
MFIYPANDNRQGRFVGLRKQGGTIPLLFTRRDIEIDRGEIEFIGVCTLNVDCPYRLNFFVAKKTAHFQRVRVSVFVK